MITPSFSVAWGKVKGDDDVFVCQVCLYMYNIHICIKQIQREYYTYVSVECQWLTLKPFGRQNFVMSHEC